MNRELSRSHNFLFLFMTNVFDQSNIGTMLGDSPNDNRVINLINKATGLDKSKARKLYTGMWFFVHGIASLLATNNCNFDDEAEQIMNDAFDGLLHSLKKKRKC